MRLNLTMSTTIGRIDCRDDIEISRQCSERVVERAQAWSR